MARASSGEGKTWRLATHGATSAEIAVAGRLAEKHMIANGQPLAQFGIFLVGQHDGSLAAATEDASTVRARAGVTKEPTINPRIANMARIRVDANHLHIPRLCQSGSKMTR